MTTIPAEAPRLETQRVMLRPFTAADVDTMFMLQSDAEVMRYGSHAPWTRREQAEAKIHEIIAGREGVISWAVELRETGKMIGDCVLFSLSRDHGRAEIGYSLLPLVQGKGLALEATRRMCAWAFDELLLRRLEADADPRNVRSTRLLEKLGFQREGLLRQRWAVGDEVQDSVVYGLLRGELRR